MSLNLDQLTDYTDEHKNELIAQSVAGAKSARVLNLQTGYKSSGTINIFNTDVVFQDDNSCGRTPDGTTSISQRVLTVGAIKVEEDICTKELNKKYTQHLVKAGSKDDVLPFEQLYTSEKALKIASATENAIWKGDTNSADANLNKFDGFLKVIDNFSGGTIDGNTSSATTITKANVEDIIDDIYSAIPMEILDKEDVAILVGFDTFRTFTQAVKNSNLFSGEGKADSNFELTIPGTTVKMIALQGLNGTSRIIAGRTSNFVVGVDLENEEETFEMWYSKDDKVVKFDANFKMGTQVAFPEIVEFTLSA